MTHDRIGRCIGYLQTVADPDPLIPNSILRSAVRCAKMCRVLHFGGNNLCVQRLACRANSASAKLLVVFDWQLHDRMSSELTEFWYVIELECFWLKSAGRPWPRLRATCVQHWRRRWRLRRSRVRSSLVSSSNTCRWLICGLLMFSDGRLAHIYRARCTRAQDARMRV